MVLVRVFVEQVHLVPPVGLGFIGFRHAAKRVRHCLGWTWRP